MSIDNFRRVAPPTEPEDALQTAWQGLQHPSMESDSRRLAAIVQAATQLSHDIRSPLSTINLALARVALPEEHRAVICAAIRRANSLADDLLGKVRCARKGSQPTVKGSRQKSFDAAAEIRRLIAEKTIEFGAKRPMLRFDSKGCRRAVKLHGISALELSRALSNLINNSVDSIGFRPGHVRVSLHMRGGRIVIAVIDNGPGIEPRLLSMLGEPGVTFGKGEQGNGLGLAHAKAFAEQAGGGLKIRSRFGEHGRARTSVMLVLPASATPTNVC